MDVETDSNVNTQPAQTDVVSISPPAKHIHFVTGRLAEHSLHEVLRELAPQAGFRYTIDVLPITVAALMTTDWVASRINKN